jgi:uncharacterized membrane protein HdeD (DUF308 family)
MRIGAVLREAWELYSRFIVQFFLTAVVVFGVLDLLSALGDAAIDDDAWAGVLWGVISAVVGIVGFFLVQGALVQRACDLREGTAERSVSETYRLAYPRLPALIAAGVVAAVLVVIGLLLLIVPGLILLTIWSMIGAVIILEGVPAAQAFNRSREIVRGHGWTVFGLIVITFLLVVIAEALIRLLFAPLTGFLEAYLGAAAAHSLTVPFAAAVLTTAYFQLTGAERTDARPLTTAET